MIIINAADLALLQDIDDQEVWYSPGHGGVRNTRTGQDALAGATRLRRHADPPLADVDFTAERLGSYPYVLTDAGREVLAAGPAGPDEDG